MCATEHIFTCPYVVCRLLSVKLPANASFISVIACKKRVSHGIKTTLHDELGKRRSGFCLPLFSPGCPCFTCALATLVSNNFVKKFGLGFINAIITVAYVALFTIPFISSAPLLHMS